jgi:hypothetical protein
MGFRALGVIAGQIFVVGGAALLVGCSGCGGIVAEEDAGDASADSTPAPGDARSADAPAPDAPPSDAGGVDASIGDAGPDGSFDCLYDAGGMAPEGGATGSGPCPLRPPVAGSPCGTTNLLCEYGSSWWSRCDLLLSCTQGVWQSSDYGPRSCPELDAGPSGGACAADTCPATWAEAVAITDAGPCPASSCQYPEGDCLCGAGTVTSCSADTWSCLPVTPTLRHPVLAGRVVLLPDGVGV